MSVSGIPYQVILPSGAAPADPDGTWPFDVTVTQ